MVYHNEDGSVTSNAAPRTIIGQTAIDAEKDATIARLTDELQAVLRREEDANKAAFAHMRRADKAEAERDAMVGAAFEHLQNVMGHVDTPISRRRLNIGANQPEWLTGARDYLRTAAYTAAIRAAEVRGMREAAGIANLNAWKHAGEDDYSRGMDAGAIHQVKACVDAILAAATKKEDARE